MGPFCLVSDTVVFNARDSVDCECACVRECMLAVFFIPRPNPRAPHLVKYTKGFLLYIKRGTRKEEEGA